MKKILFEILIATITLCSYSQEKIDEPVINTDVKGNIISVEFPRNLTSSEIPASSIEFFRDYLKTSANDEFRKVPQKQRMKDFIHENYHQYYKGIKVENAGYTFHYQNGKMFYAHGNYVKVKDLEVVPTISAKQAKECFASFKLIPSDSITDFIAELIIKEVPTNKETISSIQKLVYKVYLYANHKNNTEVGYVDANTCDVVLTEPSTTGASATGTFETRYSGTRQAITQSYSGTFNLADSTRGAIIHTWSLENNSINVDDRVELTDGNNNWTAAEHSANNDDMGLDVHWALQEIYDYLNNTYGHNCFDSIYAFVRYGNTNQLRDNARWDMTGHVLYFGQGVSTFGPVASIDAVGHEFGHGISDLELGWPYSGNRADFHEGMSDIWGIIFENRIRPHTIWKIGEQVTISKDCIRNIQNPSDPNALQQIADTYDGPTYNATGANQYTRSGPFSYWFYLLVNGGSGVNEVGDSYTVHGIGMDYAEELIVESVYNNYLNFNTTYPTIRTSMVNAANALFGTNSFQTKQVENAWYAVGVGSQPTQVTITGAKPVCYSTGETYTANNAPSGSSISWTTSSNMIVYSGGSTTTPTIRAKYSSSTGSGWVQANFTSNGYTSSVRKTVAWVGKPSFYLDGDDELPAGSAGIALVEYAGDDSPYTQGVYDVDWSSTGGLSNLRGDLTKCQYIALMGGPAYVYADATNACGSIEERKAVDVTGGFFMLMPNPSDDYVEITTRSSIEGVNLNSTETNEPFETGTIRIFDSFGMLHSTVRLESKKQRISTSHLKDGVYVIEIKTKLRTERLNLVIKH